MRTRSIALVTLTCLALGACGNDQTDVANQFIKEAKADGTELDEACVRETIKKLSDDDVKALEVGSDQELSPEGSAILGETFLKCVDPDVVVDQVLQGIPDDGTFDRECLADALREIDPTDLTSGNGAAIQDAMTKCVTGG